MPSWIETILIRVFSACGIEVDKRQLAQNYLQLEFYDIGNLELNFFPHDESLLISLGVRHRVDDDTIEHVLKANKYSNQSPLSPTGHIYEDKIVLRLLILRENLDLINFEMALNNFRQVNQSISGY
ncbi:hypothetical protein [Microbulbifer variabilis]|uniref:hypothetical protein n=1 Tax=Microbulbifer variabilis TaxID=266805 RepID=UPI001CFF467D|nr:hypothetical protein [Microbulbifer variabilis]